MLRLCCLVCIAIHASFWTNSMKTPRGLLICQKSGRRLVERSSYRASEQSRLLSKTQHYCQIYTTSFNKTTKWHNLTRKVPAPPIDSAIPCVYTLRTVVEVVVYIYRVGDQKQLLWLMPWQQLAAVRPQAVEAMWLNYQRNCSVRGYFHNIVVCFLLLSSNSSCYWSRASFTVHRDASVPLSLALLCGLWWWHYPWPHSASAEALCACWRTIHSPVPYRTGRVGCKGVAIMINIAKVWIWIS